MRNFFYKVIRTVTAVYVAMLMFLVYDLVVSEVPDNIYIREGENAKLELEIDSVKRGNQWFWMLSE